MIKYSSRVLWLKRNLPNQLLKLQNQNRRLPKHQISQRIRHGCERDKFGYTPLNEAISLKRSETADLLRKHGGKTGEELIAEWK